MRRGFAVVTLAVLIAYVSAVEGQMRGGSRIGPAPSGMRGFHGGMTGRPGPGRTAPGRVFVSPSRFGSGRVFIGAGFRHRGPVFFSGFHHRRFFGTGCFGPVINPFFCRGAFYGYPLISPYPYFWYDSYGATPAYNYVASPAYSYSADPNYAVSDPNYARGADANTELRNEVDRLTDEIDALRQQQAARTQAAPASEPPTILVFRDGKRLEVQNYGIAGQTLWIFDEHNAKKVSLSDLDLKATQEINEQRGVAFRP